jgi:hypothetical protein
MKVNMEQWWTDTARGKSKFLEKGLSQGLFVLYKSPRIGVGSNLVLRG